MLAYAIGVIKENENCVKFMTISSTTSRIRCMKLRDTYIETLITYLHIYIYILVYELLLLSYCYIYV
jgi:hypothetical protein